MPGPYTTFEAQDPAGASVSGGNAQIVSTAITIGNNAFSAGGIEIAAFGSLTGWAGKTVPQTGQMFPAKTA